MQRNEILIGSALDILPQLPANTFHCCVTSPPYYGLRDYGVEGQLGRESTPAEYVENLVNVFREVRRVLRDDGTLWLNLGDSYANDGKWGGRTSGKHASGVHDTSVGRLKRSTGLKPKDLIGIPWRVAFALQEDGWYLRSDVIWAKGNCMPESVTDRPTKSHEYVFLLTKNQDYFYDQHAIREPHTMRPQRRLTPIENRHSFGNRQPHTEAGYRTRDDIGIDGHPDGRNKRTVWNINAKPYRGAHFAVMPEELASLCIRAGSSERGACSNCGTPLSRVFETGVRAKSAVKNGIATENRAAGTRERAPKGSGGGNVLAAVPRTQIGWRQTCSCSNETLAPCIVLDPFSGAGTTAATAARLGRHFVGIELNPSYVELSLKRLTPVIERQNQTALTSTLLND